MLSSNRAIKPRPVANIFDEHAGREIRSTDDDDDGSVAKRRPIAFPRLRLRSCDLVVGRIFGRGRAMSRPRTWDVWMLGCRRRMGPDAGAVSPSVEPRACREFSFLRGEERCRGRGGCWISPHAVLRIFEVWGSVMRDERENPYGRQHYLGGQARPADIMSFVFRPTQRDSEVLVVYVHLSRPPAWLGFISLVRT